MTSLGIDEIINKLSAKFNRIFYDREFVGSVCEDLQTVIENKNKCCVLVFPTLSPNYLRVVRYQAKLFDLAVISLGSGSARSVGVCHKKYFLSTETEENSKPENSCPTQMAENAASSTRKKRPPIQLYVPPAQRRSRFSERSSNQVENNSRPSHKLEREKHRSSIEKRDSIKEEIKKHIPEIKESRENENDALKQDEIIQDKNDIKDEKNYDLRDFSLCSDDIDYLLLADKHSNFPFFSYRCCCRKLLFFKNVFPHGRLMLFSIKWRRHPFYFSRWNHISENILVVDGEYWEKWRVVNVGRHLFRNVWRDKRVGLFDPKILDFRDTSEYLKEYRNKYYLCGDSILFDIPKNKHCCYLPVPQYEVYDDGLKPKDYLHLTENIENNLLNLEEFIESIIKCIILPPQSTTEDLDLDSFKDLLSITESPQMPCEKDTVSCDSEIVNTSAKPGKNLEKTSENNNKEKKSPKKIDRVIVLEERKPPVKTGSNSPPRIKDKGKQNEHEQEKEIMRKAKQNINRKTRPIIKYVDDDNDTLKIGKGDNVNNWEELFNEDGELQEDIFSEIIQKVGPEVTVVKAVEDYSAYAAKQIEELEHMVELYDFPATLETHDIISAFSLLNSDSMYVKWVDDTRALLVLGSSIQAQRAIELAHPLIKVRPMSCASSLALEKAHHSDLKPAMKRPQTNLQTARRLITSHLGAKSKISKEQTAKEREDLRVAKELKKQAKQNERDAWEGNITSAIN